MTGQYIVRTYRQGFDALDTMHRAVTYLRAQFRMDMNREEASANLQARQIIFRREMALLDEMELEYFYGAESRGRDA